MKILLSGSLLGGFLFVSTAFYALPTAPQKTALRYVNHSIFGSEYAKTPIYDHKLAGQVYYVKSGHGGPDPGAIAIKDGHWLCEDEYAYDVALRLARNLISHGATVYVITRDPNDGIRDEAYLKMDTDEVLWGDRTIPLNQKNRLQQRADTINELYELNKAKGAKTQRLIILHVDSRYTGQKVDIFFYHNEISTSGKRLAQRLYSTVKAKYDTHQQSRGYTGVVKSRDLFMIRETKPTTVYIELGNIANEFDQRRLLIPDNRQAMANWLALGMMR